MIGCGAALAIAKMVLIRRAIPGDEEKALPAILEFYTEYVEHLKIPFCSDGVKALSKALTGPQSLSVVAEQNGVIIGFLAGVVLPWYINPEIIAFEEAAWFVEKIHRDSSIGARLYRESMKLCREAGVKLVFCGVYSGGPEALKMFYERNGYREVETRWLKFLQPEDPHDGQSPETRSINGASTC